MKTKSKKQLVAAIVAGLTLATAAPAFAAANPFVDVPAKHWAYDAVSKLAADGIIDGYGDGTFRGDRTTTRYEMAQIVGKAMANQDKANAEQKAMIDKLAQEFDDELKSLGVRVSTLENKVGNIKWSGQVRSWYEHVDDNNVHSTITDRTTRLLLFMEAPLTDDLTFKGRLWAQTGWGDRSGQFEDVELLNTGADVSMDQAYIQGKNFTFGRQGIMLGKGLTYAWFPNNDGATYTIGGDKAKLTLAAFKANDFAMLDSKIAPWLNPFPGKLNIIAADAKFKATDDLDFSLVYVKNRKSDYSVFGQDMELIKTWAIGTTYTGIDNVTLTAEYGQNDSDFANAINNDDAKGLVAQIKYKGAQWDKEHSWGTWVGYRKADLGFLGRNGDYIWETPVMFLASHPLGAYAMDDVKGFDIGFDYTLFKNGILTLQYFDLENEYKLLGDIDKKGFVGQLRYMF